MKTLTTYFEIRFLKSLIHMEVTHHWNNHIFRETAFKKTLFWCLNQCCTGYCSKFMKKHQPSCVQYIRYNVSLSHWLDEVLTHEHTHSQKKQNVCERIRHRQIVCCNIRISKFRYTFCWKSFCSRKNARHALNVYALISSTRKRHLSLRHELMNTVKHFCRIHISKHVETSLFFSFSAFEQRIRILPTDLTLIAFSEIDFFFLFSYINRHFLSRRIKCEQLFWLIFYHSSILFRKLRVSFYFEHYLIRISLVFH